MRGYILLVGPDGTGKSTITGELRAACQLEGIHLTHSHYRPGGVVPRDENAGPVTAPHAEESRPFVVGVAKVFGLALEYAMAFAGKWRRAGRSGLLVVERGWWDMRVDPRRYRLHRHVRPLVSLIGRLQPKADLVVVLGGDPASIHARKPEIDVAEVRRQVDEWQLLARRIGRRVVVLDTVTTPATEAAGMVLGALR